MHEHGIPISPGNSDSYHDLNYYDLSYIDDVLNNHDDLNGYICLPYGSDLIEMINSNGLRHALVPPSEFQLEGGIRLERHPYDWEGRDHVTNFTTGTDTGTTTTYFTTTNTTNNFTLNGEILYNPVIATTLPVTEVITPQPVNELPKSQIKGNSVKEIIITEDGRAQIIEKKVRKETSLGEILESLEKNKPISTGILPNNCILYGKYGKDEVFIIEELPGIKQIAYTSSDGFTAHNVPVSLPYLYWILIFSPALEIRVRCSKAPVRNVKQKLHLAPLLNIHNGGHGHMCAGSGVSTNVNDPVLDRIQQFRQTCWDSVWQHDLTPAMPAEYGGGDRERYDKFVEDSASDPALWAKLTYRESDDCLHDFTKRTFNNG